jgi:hypothetical protein
LYVGVVSLLLAVPLVGILELWPVFHGPARVAARRIGDRVKQPGLVFRMMDWLTGGLKRSGPSGSVSAKEKLRGYWELAKVSLITWCSRMTYACKAECGVAFGAIKAAKTANGVFQWHARKQPV